MNRNILLVFMALVVAITGAIVSLPKEEVQAEPVELPKKHLYSKPVKVPYLDFNIDELSIIRKENEDADRLDEGNSERAEEDESDVGTAEQDLDEYCGESVETVESAEDYCYDDGRNQTEGEGGDLNEDEEAGPEEEYSDVPEEAPETEEISEDYDFVDGGDGGSAGSTEEVLTSLGRFIITAYCPCEQCCGEWATGCTASGNPAVANHTVACNILPFGTRLLIGDTEYVVEDTGWSPYGDAWIDIFFDTHEEALAFGEHEMEVFMIQRIE